MSASRVFYGRGSSEVAGGNRRPPQSEFTRERRPPQQLYVPPRHRQGGASSGFNRASSPGLSTCSEIVTSWRARATPPRIDSPGPLSPGMARPPAGPRRRHSQQTGDSGGVWRQSGDIPSQSRPSSRQSVSDAAGSGRRRSGRGRRRPGGRRSRSQSEDRPASAVEQVTSPPGTPWRRGQQDAAYDSTLVQRPPSPRGAARPCFQQPYVPPARRGRESPAPPSPSPPAPALTHQRRADWSGAAGQRGRGGPASPYHDYRPGPPPQQQQQQLMGGAASPRRPAGPADEPGNTGSLGRRGSRRRRGRRDPPRGGATAQPAPPRRSLSPTDLIASLQLERGGPAPAGLRRPEPRPTGAPAHFEPQSPTDAMAHLGVRPSPLIPRIDSQGQLVNTTDDEKATLGGRGRGRGRPRRPNAPPGPPTPGVWQSDEMKAALRRPGAQMAGTWAEPSREKQAAGSAQSGQVPGAPPSCPEGPVTEPSRDVDGDQVKSTLSGSGPRSPAPHRPRSGDADVTTASHHTLPGSDATPTELEIAAARATASGHGAGKTGSVAAASSAGRSATESDLRATGPEVAVNPCVSGSQAPPGPPATGTEAPASAHPIDDKSMPSGAPAAEPDVSAAEPDTGTGPSVAVDAVVPEKSRRHSSASSAGGLFNLSLEEPFDWADEMDEWERRFNDDGDAMDDDGAKRARSPPKRQPSGGGLGSRRQQTDRPEPDQDTTADPSLPAHVIELYNFPSGFSKRDFNTVFGNFVASGFDVRPVDDKHALGIFSSAACASEALRLCHPMLLSRPLWRASARSRQCAANVPLPPRRRPETSTLHAGRMVAAALGVHQPGDGRARQRRDQEKRRLRDAKDKKRLTNKQRNDAWEGRF